MRRWGLGAILACLLCTPTAAAETLVITKAGYWLLSQDASGVPTLKKIDQVIKLDEGPTIPNPPPTTALATHRAAVLAATTAVVDANKANTKKALAELYRTVAGLPVTTREQLAQATDTLFGALGLPAWAPWKIAVDKSLAGFASLADAKPAWVAVAEVLAQ